MVDDADAEDARRLDQAACDVDVLLARGRVTRGMVVLCAAPTYVESPNRAVAKTNVICACAGIIASHK